MKISAGETSHAFASRGTAEGSGALGTVGEFMALPRRTPAYTMAEPASKYVHPPPHHPSRAPTDCRTQPSRGSANRGRRIRLSVPLHRTHFRLQAQRDPDLRDAS